MPRMSPWREVRARLSYEATRNRGDLAPRSFAFGELLPPPPAAGSRRSRSVAIDSCLGDDADPNELLLGRGFLQNSRELHDGREEVFDALCRDVGGATEL